MMRLNRFLALCGLGSRRKCESLIQAGRVTVNGYIVKSLSTTIDEENNIVKVDGQRISPPDEFVYILLNKPIGYITTASDELGRKTVVDLLPHKFRVFPVGRLDRDTTGALLLTNDGYLSFQLMHPKFNVEKIYHVSLNKPIIESHVRKLQTGILLGEGVTGPCKVKIIRQHRKKIEIILHEGRKRQIRRMLKSLGYDVVSLARIQFASLSLTGLKPGEWRYLTDREIADLKAVVPGYNG
ncbi:MAG: rRNA pseudouridine synthase [bacterium]|nr:MAG: rRNA pseudouridine synthase [bacterium]